MHGTYTVRGIGDGIKGLPAVLFFLCVGVVSSIMFRDSIASLFTERWFTDGHGRPFSFLCSLRSVYRVGFLEKPCLSLRAYNVGVSVSGRWFAMVVRASLSTVGVFIVSEG